MKVLIQIIVKFKAKKIFVCVSITKDSFEGHEVSVTRTMVLIWKWKVHLTQPHNFVHDFWKKNITRRFFLHHVACVHQKSQRGIHKIFSTHKIPLCRLVVFIDMNIYKLTEGGRSFKTFLKENYAIALDRCYVFTKKCWIWTWKWYI